MSSGIFCLKYLVAATWIIAEKWKRNWNSVLLTAMMQGLNNMNNNKQLKYLHYVADI